MTRFRHRHLWPKSIPLATQMTKDKDDGYIPHPSEELEFATIHPTLTSHTANTAASHPSIASHPSEALDFITALHISGDDDTLNDNLSADEKGGPKHIYTEDYETERASSSSASQRQPRKPGFAGTLVLDDTDPIARTTSNDAVYDGMRSSIPNLRSLVSESRAAVIAERQMTFLQGLRLYPKAILWSGLLSLTLVMEGYDLTIINGFYAFPQFVRRYGTYSNRLGDYEIAASWQAALTNGAIIGEILGLLVNGACAPLRPRSHARPWPSVVRHDPLTLRDHLREQAPSLNASATGRRSWAPSSGSCSASS